MGVWHIRQIAAANVGVSDCDFGPHGIEQIIQVGPMHDMGQKLAVVFFHARPVTALHVFDVEIVALITPPFVEDLLEFFLRIEVHAQGDSQLALSRRWGHFVGVDKEDRGRDRGFPWDRRAARTVGQLMAVRADIVIDYACYEGNQFAIT